MRQGNSWIDFPQILGMSWADISAALAPCLRATNLRPSVRPAPGEETSAPPSARAILDETLDLPPSGAALAALDNALARALRSGAIKLLDPDALCTFLDTIARRQELEELERDQGTRLFLTPEEAVAALGLGTRSVMALTYGWAAVSEPDPTGEYLAAVRRFLGGPLGAHVRGVFWDCGSLPQLPRSEVEDALCMEALAVMGDVYSSPLGTTVVRHKAVPR
jgi:hypothetical protein